MNDLATTILANLTALPEDTTISFSLSVAAARRALSRATGGPEWLSTAQAAEIIGGSSRIWRQWAEKGWIEGARRDQAGNWRLPNTSARAQFERWLSGEKSRSDNPPYLQPEVPTPVKKRRGPRKR
jgi:hypothetical protein